MVEFLGWLNVVLILSMGFLYPLKKLALISVGNLDRGGGRLVLEGYKKSSRIHPFIGGLILIIAFVHSYLAMGFLKFHSGTLNLITILLMGIIAVLGNRTKKLRNKWRRIHKVLGVILLLLILNHISR